MVGRNGLEHSLSSPESLTTAVACFFPSAGVCPGDVNCEAGCRFTLYPLGVGGNCVVTLVKSSVKHDAPLLHRGVFRLGS